MIKDNNSIYYTCILSEFQGLVAKMEYEKQLAQTSSLCYTEQKKLYMTRRPLMENKQLSSIALVLPYFGKFPNYFPLFLDIIK